MPPACASIGPEAIPAIIEVKNRSLFWDILLLQVLVMGECFMKHARLLGLLIQLCPKLKHAMSASNRRGWLCPDFSHIVSGGSSGQAVCNFTVCLLNRSMFM